MMRCLAIAAAMRRLHCEATFFVADMTSAKMVAEAGFGYYCLHSDYDHLDVEADKLLQIMRDKCADNLLVDSYFVTENYLQKIRQIANVAYIDDIDKFIYPCDLLINYNIYADSLRYPERYRAAGLGTRFALGLAYMPLRDEYSTMTRAVHEGRRVLVTTGATDSQNVIAHFLREMRMSGLLEKMEPYAVIGRYNHNREDLLREFGGDPRIHLIDPQKNLVGLITQCDFAVTAGGTTVYELCAGGIPSVMLTIADNQKKAAMEFSKQGIIPYAGDVREDICQVMVNTMKYLGQYLEDDELARRTSENMRRVVDGHGATRVAKRLLELAANKNDEEYR